MCEFAQMKVVIPTSNSRESLRVFSTPLSEYEVCDHDIDRKWSSNRPFEVSNINFLGGYTWGQQVLTKVDGN